MLRAQLIDFGSKATDDPGDTGDQVGMAHPVVDIEDLADTGHHVDTADHPDTGVLADAGVLAGADGIPEALAAADMLELAPGNAERVALEDESDAV